MPLPGNQGGRSGKTYSHYVIMDEAKKFLRANKDRPFFCYLCVTPPHGMFDIPADDPSWALYKDKPASWPTEAKRYAAMVHMLDRHVGEVISLLKELNLDRDTIIFFCGDNGGADYFRTKDRPRGFFGANVHPKTGVEFRGHKGNLYEGGLRVPMVVRWPGHIQPKRVSDFLWYFPDVLPTLAELAGAETPKDIDGISIVPELLGQAAAGRKQAEHELLYWELGRQVAVRRKHWKAIRPRPNAEWELYDLSRDLEEKTNVAAEHADVLAKMKAFAKQAHQPARPGVFHNREIHEKDRRAKWGGRGRRRAGPGKVNEMPPDGLIPSKDWKIVRASSESRASGKLARHATDGDAQTWWHSEFQPQLRKHPHELVIDLGKEYEIRGFRYLGRQDGGWNGALKECELYVAAAPTGFKEPAAKAVFRKIKAAQEVTCKPVRGRYVLLRTLSAQDDGPWACVAELGVVGK